MKKIKGFTLIVLLAIIVILAVIAVITVPIILGIIDDAKAGAAKDSAYAYKKAISQYYYSRVMIDGEYIIPDGEYEISFFKNDGLAVSGQEPSDGWVVIENRNVTDFSFIIDDYVVTYNSETNTIEAIKNGELALTPTMQIVMAEKSAAMNSANTYVSALEGLLTKITSETKEVSDLNELVMLDIEPDFGWIVFDDSGNASSYSLKFGEYVVNYDSSLETNQKTVAIGNVLSKPIPGVIVNGVKYYDTLWVKSNVVRYNPGSVATENTNAVNPGKCESGDDCRTWYPYSEFTENNQTYVNLMLDRNMTQNVKWISLDDYEGSDGSTRQSKINTVGITYPADKETFGEYGTYSNNSKGPITLLKQLHVDTDSWNLPFRHDSYTPETNSYSNYTIDYSGYKARIISAEELAIILGKNTPSNLTAWSTAGNVFYFGSLSNNVQYRDQNETQKARQRSFSWLFDYMSSCTSHGCTIQMNGNYTYWTVSPTTTILFNKTSTAWTIDYNGILNRHNGSDSYGFRPVITVLKDDIL